MKNILFYCQFIFYAAIFYWIAVVQIATAQNNKSANYDWIGVSYYNNNMTHEGDSCRTMGEKYKLKAEKTLTMLPKFLRP
jgi:beta-glucosidase/6-phospho-beta-glucosidase/beta-galactosidase